MRAAVIERPGVLTVCEVPMPVAGDYEALCELLYGATCTGTDQHLIAGRFPWPISYPAVLGHESIGRVVEVGRRARHLRPGDLVTRVGTRPSPGLAVCWGGFAEYGVAVDWQAMQEDGLPAREWHGHRINQTLPPGTDAGAATMMTTWRETLSYSTRMGVGPGAAVLVIGSGGNGLSFVAHAANLGAGSVVLLGSGARESAGRAAGATGFVDYQAADAPARLAEAAGDGFAFVIDAVGRPGQIDLALPVLRPGGTVGIYGIDAFGRCPINAQLARGSFTFYNRGYDEGETHQQVLDFWQAGRLDAGIWLDLEHPFALEQIGEAFATVRERRLVKALVRLSGNV
jgi:L-iditol 2-dehydrogenase